MSKIAVFGDLSGHFEPFEKELFHLGVVIRDGEVAFIPDGLVIVQVGDLIHKGPDSERNVHLAYEATKKFPGQWIQLFGNHEAQYLGGPLFWQNFIDKESQIKLHMMLKSRRLLSTCAVKTETNQWLISHGGLTKYWYDTIFGDGTHALDVASDLNSHPEELYGAIFTPGLMLGERGLNPGVTWAEGRVELRYPWLDADSMPFNQIHGHSQALMWSGSVAGWQIPDGMKLNTHASNDGHIITEHYDKKLIVGIDPGATARYARAPIPWILHGEVYT